MTKILSMTIEKLLNACQTYLPNNELSAIEEAYKFAKDAHHGQFRQTGEEYINHPLHVAYNLTKIYADQATIMAALLHDTVEDCDVSLDTIEKQFGKEVAKLVDGVTKINHINFSTKNDAVIANHQKILVGLVEDVRVIIIKFADRLNNLQTLWVKDKEAQKVTAKETLEIFAPIANRLGIHKIKSQLEDLSLRYLKPDAYYDIVEKLNKSKAERDAAVHIMIAEITSLLDKYHIHHQIKGRSKSIYSIYKKLEGGRSFNDIYDLQAMRIFVDTESDCYLTLGAIHAKYKPVPKRFKDFIAMPKSNMYQSLHTTVIGYEGLFFEIQIRTPEMEQIAEYGLASHSSYKEKKYNSKNIQADLETKLKLFRNIIELKEEATGDEDFVRSVKEDILGDSIFVYTPNGDVIDVPINATPLDFAYKIHSEIGHKTVNVLINNKIAPLDSQLQDGDVVKIITSNNQTPNRDWINIVKTTHAKNKIKAFFNKVEKVDHLKIGEDEFRSELRKRKLSFNEIVDSEEIKKLFTEYKIINLEDLYIGIGSGRFTANFIVNQLTKIPENKEEQFLEKISRRSDLKNNTTDEIIVKGIDHIKTSLASCCRPVYGDQIIGYISKGEGITVHQAQCNNLINLEERLIEVHWNNQVEKKYPTNILITTIKGSQKLLKIMTTITTLNINIQSVNTITNNNHTIYDIIILVENTERINNLITKINKIPDVIKAERIIK